MELTPNNPPREFTVGKDGSITIQDCGSLFLMPDQQVTFLTENGAEYDVARKAFGFYATPSLNARLPNHGLRPALLCNERRQYFVMLVEPDKMAIFEAYMADESQELICWLDNQDSLEKIAQSFKSK